MDRQRQLKSSLLNTALIFSILIVSMCSQSLASQGPARIYKLSRAQLSSNASNVQCAVPFNAFVSARGLSLNTDFDFDSYIDRSLPLSDRIVARKLMRLMPPGQRGDFVLMDHNRRLMSNNPALLRCAQFTPAAAIANQGIGNAALTRPKFAVRKPADYSSQCSPPNPGNTPGGPYNRIVSICGFSAGWGFVNVPCGESNFAPGDEGQLYFEIRGATGSLVEGGLQYNNDSSVQPYLRSTVAGLPNFGYISLTNSGAKYACGQNLVIWHGVTSDHQYVFTEIGQLPGNYDPATAWIDQQVISLNNAAWLFSTAPTDYYYNGTDPAGASTPCSQCSVSRVTSIAQGEPYAYKIDGSYFGLAPAFASGLQWMQIAFGNWGSDCEPGTSLCTFFVPSDPNIYYGGAQFFPNNQISQSNQGPTGYGPYESYDSIDVTGNSGQSVLRKAAGLFREPLPPTPCTADRYGNCLSLESETLISQCKTKVDGAIPNYKRIYRFYHLRAESTFTENDVFSGPPLCQTETIKWYPSDPAKTFHDPTIL